MSKIKLLVTGSGGFIFSNFVRYILKNYSTYSVASIDRCDSTKVLNTIYSNKGHSFHIGDVADEHFINVIFEMEKPDYVIHGAAKSLTDCSTKESLDFVHSNVQGTQIITNACIKHGVKKLIYVSTNEVYGDSKNISRDESHSLHPHDIYAATKAAGELIVQAANTHGLIYNITRSCNNYGPRQSITNLIPIIVSNILNDKEVTIYTRGDQIRDWIHVQDNCSAILKVMESGKDNEIYNISAKQEFMNIELVHEICNILGRGHEFIKFLEDKSIYDLQYTINNDKLKELGWKPEFKFKDGLFHTVKWYQNNMWFLR